MRASPLASLNQIVGGTLTTGLVRQEVITRFRALTTNGALVTLTTPAWTELAMSGAQDVVAGDLILILATIRGAKGITAGGVEYRPKVTGGLVVSWYPGENGYFHALVGPTEIGHSCVAAGLVTTGGNGTFGLEGQSAGSNFAVQIGDYRQLVLGFIGG